MKCLRASFAFSVWSIVVLLLSSLTTIASAQSNVCKPADTRPRAGSASVAQPAGESLQNKQWQPIGGLIEITVNNFKPADADAVVTTCFRWKVKEGDPANFVESQPTRVDLSNGVLKVTAEVPNLPDTSEKQSVARRVWLVPLAEVRVVARKGDTVVADAWTEIGITRPFISLALALAVVILALVALNIVVKRRIKHDGILKANWFLRIISTPSATASLSQFQILLWTFVVAGSAIYVATLSGQLVEITTGALVLLGISGVATLATQAHGENQASTKQVEADKTARSAEQVQQAVGASPSPVAQDMVAAAQEKAEVAQDKLGAIKNPPPAKTPQWSDLVVNENESGVREIDVTRVQMLLFTLISAIFVAVKVIAAYVIPEIPVGYLTLMGISNGVYIGSKVVRQT
jgi:hypothetical protein